MMMSVEKLMEGKLAGGIAILGEIQLQSHFSHHKPHII
jgi:hypothetical protein